MDEAIAVEIERLDQMRIEELRERYREVFGETSSSSHRQHLVRRIAWRLQVLAGGDLSERARQRALAIACDADLKTQVPRGWGPRGEVRQTVGRGRRDRRLPLVGTVLRRMCGERSVEMKVLAEGFEYQGQRYASLSAVARAVTGTRWNGLLFFGLVRRRKAKPHAGR